MKIADYILNRDEFFCILEGGHHCSDVGFSVQCFWFFGVGVPKLFRVGVELPKLFRVGVEVPKP